METRTTKCLRCGDEIEPTVNASEYAPEIRCVICEQKMIESQPELLEACRLAIATHQVLEDQLPENQAMQELADTLREAVEAAV